MTNITTNNNNKRNDDSGETTEWLFGFVAGFMIWFNIMVAILLITDIVPSFYIIFIGGLVLGAIYSKVHVKIIRYRNKQ